MPIEFATATTPDWDEAEKFMLDFRRMIMRKRRPFQTYRGFVDKDLAQAVVCELMAAYRKNKRASEMPAPSSRLTIISDAGLGLGEPPVAPQKPREPGWYPIWAGTSLPNLWKWTGLRWESHDGLETLHADSFAADQVGPIIPPRGSRIQESEA